MSYRIKEYKRANGNSLYYPQKREFIFWFYFTAMYVCKWRGRVYEYQTCFHKDFALQFRDFKEAQSFISEIKAVDKNREDNELRKKITEVNTYKI